MRCERTKVNLFWL